LHHIKEGTATERQKRIWEYIQQQREAGEDKFLELEGDLEEFQDIDKQYFRNNFNTQLTPEQEKEFQSWLKEESKRQRRDISFDLEDYDIRGFWLNKEKTDSRGHRPDKWKKPNHPTFSSESVYHNTANEIFGGKWVGGVWKENSFTPSREMLKHTHTVDFLKSYFKKFETGAKLVLPEGFSDELDLFLAKDIEEDLKDPRKRHKQLVADVHYLANSGYARLKEGKKWGDWNLKEILKFFGAIIDVLRKECFYPYIPPRKDDPSYNSSFWKCYRTSQQEGFLETKPPPKQMLKDWAKKRKELLKFSGDSHPGIYLTEPHSEYIWAGVKPYIVKSVEFQAHINEPLYLLSKDRCWGVVKLSEPEEITSKQEFKEQYPNHLIENFERVEWWQDKFPLYKYKIELLEKFEQPKSVELPHGTQVFLKPKSIKFRKES